MRRLFILTMASLAALFTMAAGRNDGSTKANAIDFNWNTGVEHQGGPTALWYRVDLAPLYDEENPSLALYLTNPSNEVGTSVDVSMQATVAGQTETKDYTIAARQYKTYTANASTLVRMKQTEIYLTLKSTGPIKLSAKVFEAADLDETCKDARTLNWGTAVTQNPSYSAWWRVSLKPIKDVMEIDGFDAKVTITNTGSETVNLKVGQSLDCPSSGLTKRNYVLAPNESVVDTIPRAMINGVQPDEVYFGIENIESPVSIKVEKVAQPTHAIIPEAGPFTDLHVTDTIEPLPGQKIYRIKVDEMNSQAKYEPEFTYRNVGNAPAKVTVKMAFEVPAFGTSNTTYELAPGEEEIVVYKKNMLEGMDGVQYIYLLTIVEGEVNFYGRFKHVREGKACKTNIDFNWESGHSQEARTTQWYAVDIADARDNLMDIKLHVWNQSAAKASVKASMAFSCPYIDLQEVSRSIKAGDTVSHRVGFSSYAMMSDTVWIGLETSQDIRFWAETVPAELKPEPDYACEDAKPFDWEEGVRQNAHDTVWYRINMDEVREQAAKFPTVFVQNLSATSPVKITAELSVECPDEIENEKRTLKIAANGSYTKRLSSNLFEHIVQDEVYVRVVATQDISLQIRLTEEAEGSSCESAVPFNWTSGNRQEANANLWYRVNLDDVLTNKEDVLFKIENKENAEGEFIWKVAKECEEIMIPSVERFQLKAREAKTILKQYASLRDLQDSVIYIGLEGTTSLYLSATRQPVPDIDTIYREGLVIEPIALNDGEVTAPADSVEWKQLRTEDIETVRSFLTTDPKTLALYFNNSSAAEAEVLIEVAYAFPITEQMYQLRYSVPAGASQGDTLNWAEFNEKVGMYDSIYVRVTIPKAAVGSFSYTTQLVDAFDGASREEAVPLVMNKRYEQQGMTERWYKVNTSDLKRDKDLYNKVLKVVTKNIGDATATINMAVYDGLLSNEDLLFGYFTDDHSRKVKKGQGRSHNIPAQAFYALGDVELYIWVRTTQKLMFETKFNGTYPTIAEEDLDTTQYHAKLVVPNVDYILPADTDMWFMVCAPYIRNNYKYVQNSTLEYAVLAQGKAKIEVTGTLQDTMTYKMPVRKRTFKARSGKRYLRDLADKAVKHFLPDFGIPELPEEEMDSLIRRFTTSDSITGYIRVRSDKPLRIRLNTPQTTGDACLNPMDFDWEHGNVNPGMDTTWLHVSMQVDDPRIPEGKDLKLHMDNWTESATHVRAVIYEEDCDGEDLGSVNKVIVRDTTKIIERDLLVKWGWAGFMIEYSSDSTTHIWAEIVDHMDHDTIFRTIPNQYVCPYTDYKDSLGYSHNIDPEDPSTWTFENVIDSVIKSEAKIVTYVYTFNVYPKAEPTLPQIAGLQHKPAVAKGTVLDCSAATAELYAKFNDPALGDTIMKVGTGDSIKWEYCVDGETWLDIPAEALDTAAIGLHYTIITECGDILTSDDWIYIPTYDINVEACDSYKWPRTGKTYTSSQVVVSPEIPINALTSKYERLNLTINHSGTGDEYVAICTAELPYKWKDTLCEAAGDYTFDTLTVAGCDSLITLHLTVNDAKTGEENMAICAAELPYKWKDTWCEAAGDYTFDTLSVAGCDSVITLHLTVNQPGTGEEYVTICAAELPYKWKDTLCAAAGDYTFDTLTVLGCDSVITLHLTVNPAQTSEEYRTICSADLPYKWKDTWCTTAGDYTFDTLSVAGCDSVITLHLTVVTAVSGSETVAACNSYHWKTDGNTYYKDTTVTYTIAGGSAAGCDSIVTLYLTINEPMVFELEAVAKYGNRLLMINRLDINEKTGWDLDSLGANTVATEVKWWRMESLTDPNPQQVGVGYYLTNEQNPNAPLVGIYYATIELPSKTGGCGVAGRTKNLICTAPVNAAPVLMPSLARPGEEVRVLNLNPSQQTTIRVYTTEGLIQGTYTVNGEESFVIKAAVEHGFYLVELTSDSMRTTLRYIVK